MDVKTDEVEMRLRPQEYIENTWHNMKSLSKLQ